MSTSERAARNPVSAEEVVGWFAEAIKRGPMPDASMVAGLVAYLALPGYTGPPRKPQRDPDIARLADALKTLREVLPDLVAHGNQRERQTAEQCGENSAWTRDHRLRAKRLRALEMAASAAWCSFPVWGRSGGKKSSPWHSRAQMVAQQVGAVMRLAGHRNVRFTASEGPAVKVVQKALAHMEGFERPRTQIVEAFRRQGR